MFTAKGVGIKKLLFKFEKRNIMSFAEQKVELFKIVADADEETTGKLIELANQLTKKNYKFSDEEIAMFENTRNEFMDSGEKGYTIEEAHKMIRNKFKQ